MQNILEVNELKVTWDASSYKVKPPKTNTERKIGWDPSVCKSGRLHVDILRFSFIKLGYVL